MPPRRFTFTPAILAGVIVLATMAGCGEEGSTPESGDAKSATEASAPAAESSDSGSPIVLDVAADKTHAVQPGDEIRITVSVEGFVLDGASIGAEAVPGTGHYHAYLGSSEGEPLLVSANASAVVKVPDDVTDGTHSLRIELRNHDHSPLSPPIETTVRLIIYRL